MGRHDDINWSLTNASNVGMMVPWTVKLIDAWLTVVCDVTDVFQLSAVQTPIKHELVARCSLDVI